ncbi:MAG: riboflavin synthase [Desulfobacterota bacterium]|nr:riboflavin synthase [Thermodesulfobacteriota bacterium]
MFTGIVEGTGRVLRIDQRGEGKRLTVLFPDRLTEVQLGDSISINGVCLTVTEQKGMAFAFDLSEETVKKSTLGQLKVGERVNLERALRIGSRLGGHFVTGHIDGTGTIVEKKVGREFIRLEIEVPNHLLRYFVPKGSIAVDGVSLTVNEIRGNVISLLLIPHTLEKTTLIDKRVGDAVNLEADLLGKYVERLLGHPPRGAEGLTLSFLKEHGYVEDDGGSDDQHH